MDNWTKKTGYPVLSLEQDKEGKLHGHQHRFLSSGATPDEEVVWWLSVGFVRYISLPLSLSLSLVTYTSYLFSSNSATPHYVDMKTSNAVFDVESVKHTSWLKANATQSGFFRYPPPLAYLLPNWFLC